MTIFDVFMVWMFRSQEEKGQGWSDVPDDAEGWSAGDGLQGSGAVGG